MLESQEKGLAVAALLIDILSAYVLVKRIAVRVNNLRQVKPSSRNLRLVS